MAEDRTNPKVDAVLSKEKRWQEEFRKLRALILGCDLIEELKWGVPCYTLQDRNVVLIHGFKEYCAMLFFKGALMKDANGILIQQTANVQAGRQIRFTDLRQIADMEPVLTAYVREAIELEKSGAKVDLKKTAEFTMPDEFQNKLKHDPALEAAFHALTPGRQRAYLLHFSGAKQAKTREARIEKHVLRILDGKGLDD